MRDYESHPENYYFQGNLVPLECQRSDPPGELPVNAPACCAKFKENVWPRQEVINLRCTSLSQGTCAADGVLNNV